jgi:hypothetical protein
MKLHAEISLFTSGAAHQFQCKNPTGARERHEQPAEILLTFQYFAPTIYIAFFSSSMGCQKSILPEKFEAIIFYESVKRRCKSSILWKIH